MAYLLCVCVFALVLAFFASTFENLILDKRKKKKKKEKEEEFAKAAIF